jgi:hypothetical protein
MDSSTSFYSGGWENYYVFTGIGAPLDNFIAHSYYPTQLVSFGELVVYSYYNSSNYSNNYTGYGVKQATDGWVDYVEFVKPDHTITLEEIKANPAYYNQFKAGLYVLAWRYENNKGILKDGGYELLMSCINTIGTEFESATMESIWNYLDSHYLTIPNLLDFENSANNPVNNIIWLNNTHVKTTFSLLVDFDGYSPTYQAFGYIDSYSESQIVVSVAKISFFSIHYNERYEGYNFEYYDNNYDLFESIAQLTLVRKGQYYVLDFLGYLLVFDLPSLYMNS